MRDSQWIAEDPPMVAVVANALTTDLGSCGAAPEFGVRFATVQNVDDSTGAAWEAEIRRALQPYVLAGLLTDLDVRVETSTSGHTARVLYEVAFVDVRAGRRGTFRAEV